VAPRHELVPSAVRDLVAFVARDDLPVLAQAAVAHAQFENIHPFPDGNGRVGRALLHAGLRHGGLTRRVVVPISSGLLADTGRYFAALEAYREGDVQAIVACVCEAVFPSLDNARRLVGEVREARRRWSDQITARRGASAWGLADLLTRRPVVDVKLVAAELGVTPVNAQLAVDRLVDDGVLTQVGHGARDRVWQAYEIVDALESFADRSHRRAV
jgi:Fic family protein